MTRTVADAAVLMTALTKPDARDYMALPYQEIDWPGALQGDAEADLKGKKTRAPSRYRHRACATARCARRRRGRRKRLRARRRHCRACRAVPECGDRRRPRWFLPGPPARGIPAAAAGTPGEGAAVHRRLVPPGGDIECGRCGAQPGAHHADARESCGSDRAL